MMSIDDQQIRAIAFLAARCRPTGATPWDEPGIVANLRKVTHLNLAEVVIATVRAAANREAASPGVIAVTNGEHWREKVAERPRPHPPRRDEQCTVCGYHLDRCICGNQATRPTNPGNPAAGAAACRAALRKEEA